MKSFIRIITIMLTVVLLFSSVAVTATAAEFENYYEEFSELYGDVNNDWLITIKDVTAIQKYLAKLTELSENARRMADVDASGDITISDATLIQKLLAEFNVSFPALKYEPDVYCFVDKPVEIEFAADDEFIVSLLIKEDGFYDIVATPSVGSDLFFEITNRELVNSDVLFSETDGESASFYGYLTAATYEIHITTWGYENVVATFSVSESDSEPPFVKEEAKELKIGDKISVPAGESKYVYKVELNDIRNTADTFVIYTEGDNTQADLTGYSEIYSVWGYSFMPDDSSNVMLYVSYDYDSDWIYVTVEVYEESGEFTLCCDSLIDLYKADAEVIELGLPVEIQMEEFSLSTDDEEFSFCVAEGTYKFTPDADCYYSFTYNCDKPVSIVHTVTNFENDYTEMIPFIRYTDGSQVMDVRHLTKGIDYYLEVMADAEEKASLTLTVRKSTEAAYNEVRAEDEDWLVDAPFGEAVYEEINIGDTVEVDLPISFNDACYLVFTAQEDCEIVLYSENSIDAYIEVRSADGEVIYVGDDITVLESNDFAVLGKMKEGETCYIRLLSLSETGDSFTFSIVDSADYTPLA